MSPYSEHSGARRVLVDLLGLVYPRHAVQRPANAVLEAMRVAIQMMDDMTRNEGPSLIIRKDLDIRVSRKLVTDLVIAVVLATQFPCLVKVLQFIGI